MKRIVFSFVAFIMVFTLAHAQKTIIKTESFSDTQARMLEVTANSYIRPLVADLIVEKGQTRKVFKHKYTKSEVEIAMNGNLDNLRSRAVYDAASEWNCDAVVAATFKIELTEDMLNYEVEMKGFPANFDPQSWHPLAEEDFEWLQVNKEMSMGKDYNDPNRIGEVIKNVKNSSNFKDKSILNILNQ